MRILHTADWHLGDRLGRIDRTADLQRAVEQIAGLCEAHRVEVLLVAGDLFSELSRPDSLRASVEHLAKVFVPFLVQGGTIIAVTGNHDNETFCQTLRHTMSLAAPAGIAPGSLLPSGRFYLAAEPTFLRLADRDGRPVQFVLMPYPTPHRYLDDRSRRYQSLEEKNQALQAAGAAWLRDVRQAPGYDAGLPAVLVAHIQVGRATLANLFRLTERESIVFGPDDLPDDWAYVALGHIHRPQCVLGRPHFRYSGSIARLDLGEWEDRKEVILVDLGPDGRASEPVSLPLEARPIYEVVITNPPAELPRLRERFPNAAEALVRYHVVYEAGRDILNDVLAELDNIFPYWYDRTWSEAGEHPQPNDGPDQRPAGQSFRDTVLGYLGQQLLESRDRDEVLRLAEALLEEEGAPP